MVGYGVRISRVGTIGDFGRVGEAVAIVVGIGVVLYAVLVEILYHVCDGYGEVFLYVRIVLVAHFGSDGEGRVGLEVEDCCRSEGSVSVDGEQVVGIRSIYQSEGKGRIRIGVGGVEFPARSFPQVDSLAMARGAVAFRSAGGAFATESASRGSEP